MSAALRLLAASLLLLPAACRSPLSAEAPPARSEAGLEIVPLTISSGARKHRFRVEVAATPEQQARGLMYRKPLGPNEGMIFPFPEPRPANFFMKNTPSPLDLIFIAPDRRIESIAADAMPFSLDHLSSQGPVAAVLEIRGGRAAELGLAPGDRVRWGPEAGR